MSVYNSEYVSCMRIYGEPILPPVMTPEVRRKCRIYRQQAMDVEKRLQERRRLLEKQKLETLEEESSHECDVSNDSDSSSIMEVIDFIRSALGDSHNLEEVKFLISQVGEELKNRRSVESRNSTCNDVDSISLNQNTDSSSLQEENNYFERESVGNSIIHLDEHPSECKKNEKKQLIPEACVSDSVMVENNLDKSINNTNDTLDFVSNIITDSHLNNDESEYLLTDLSKNGITSDEEDKTISPTKSNETGIITPPRLIRSNSYTLDSPSPSVIMYLRSLAIGKSNEKSEVSSNIVKNLNNFYWEEETHNLSPQSFFELENGNGNLELSKNDNYEHKYNGHCSDIDNEHEELNSPKTSTDEKLLKAASIIQAAGRGFLVRRLMKTQKMKDLKTIIKEAVLCAWSLYGEKAVSPADIQLHERIMQQVTAACYELHCIFFNWSTADRMALIRTDREKLRNPKPKFRVSRTRGLSESDSVSMSSMRSKSTSSISRMTRSTGSSQLQRPTTLPSNPRSKVMYQQQWSR